jgi:hypothetical protein
MQDQLSPAQVNRIAALQDRYPDTRFTVDSVDEFSRLAVVEVDDLETFAYLAITADGRNVPERIALGWAATR